MKNLKVRKGGYVRLIYPCAFMCALSLPVLADVPAMLDVDVIEQSKGIVVTGTVLDESGLPVIGANIMVKGMNVGTITDMDGHFSLEVPYAEASLTVSFIGYTTQDVPLKGRKNVDVVLVEDTKTLQEVVVVGYGSQKKATLTGAVASVNVKELSQSPSANITNALAGRMPGLTVTQFGGGEPGKDVASFSVRGLSSYNTSAQSPIIIVDGVERSIETLDPNEIETFSILKDASATAVYGIRGANGVVIVTTKKGVAQSKPTVEFKAQAGIASPVSFPDYLGSADYARLYNQALKNDNPGWADDPSIQGRLFSDEMIANWERAKGDNTDGLGYNIDLFDYAFRPAIQQNYTLSLRGGSDRARYFAMIGYFNQDGNYRYSDLNDGYSTNGGYNRYNLRANLDIDITKNFYVSVGIGGQITDTNESGGGSENIIFTANTTPPIYPVVLERNGHPANETYYMDHPNGLLFGNNQYTKNILGEIAYMGYKTTHKINFQGNFVIGHKLDFITKGLKVEGMFSYDMEEGHVIDRSMDRELANNEYYGGYATFYPTEGLGIYADPQTVRYSGAYTPAIDKFTVDKTKKNDYLYYAGISRLYMQAKLDYQRSFGNHNVAGMFMMNRSQRNVGNEVAYRYQGFAARVTYDYANKYLFEANVGINGSENFSKAHRYGVFPSFSLGWVPTEEKFMASSRKWLDYLKFRTSLGWVGNDQGIGRFLYVQYYNTTDASSWNTGTEYNQGMGGGLEEGDLANPDLTWERGIKFNFGVDMRMFNSRLSLALDAFYERRWDIITNTGGNDVVGIPDLFGKTSSYVNAGTVINRGIDIELGWNDRIGRDFTYYVRFNAGFARNKILDMMEIDREVPWMRRTGCRVGEHFVYEVDHFVKDQAEADKLNAMNNGTGFQPWGKLAPGDVVYKDLNGDGKIDDQHDLKPMGNPKIPELQFGLPIGFSYKGWDLSLLFQGAALSSLQLSGPAVYDFPTMGSQGNNMGKVKGMHLDSWTPENPNAKYPALHLGNHPNNKNDASSLFLYDASYLRLKNIEIGYSLPQKWIQKVHLQQVRFYLQGMNLLTFDKLGDVNMDPETGDGDGSWYPIQRVYNFGVNVTF
ncbi:TonB-dependent receptor [Bacteroides caecicola]|uniref:TonB-dependent receptor n=1 Tax=Bacteroides caecicola TaxID=1462569 RepID=A0ABS2F9T2_9BACE|nr:TonB-dependent receptor [Bacteroides caecicola]MBM6807017.1 TonB-dependent receptor [Bacteroides caecicola]